MVEPAAVTDAGIVDEHVDGEAAGFHDLQQRGRAAGFAKIGGNDGDLGTGGIELCGKRLHRLAAAGDENQIVSVSRGLACKLRADAARRAGHKRNGTSGIGHGGNLSVRGREFPAGGSRTSKWAVANNVQSSVGESRRRLSRTRRSLREVSRE